jgi:hypothetical protein
LLAKLERRFSNGLNLLASYTWSKTLTDADSALPAFATFSGGGSVQNSYNLDGEKSVSFQDIRHTFVLSYIYELPFGPHKKFRTACSALSSDPLSSNDFACSRSASGCSSGEAVDGGLPSLSVSGWVFVLTTGACPCDGRLSGNSAAATTTKQEMT